MRKRHLMLAAATVGVASLGISRQAFAVGYASELTISGTSGSFDLNESVSGSVPGSSAGSVTLVYNGTTQSLGALAAGIQTFTLTATPTTPVQVEVQTKDAPGYLAANTGPYGLETAPALEVDPPGLAGAPDYGSNPYGIAVNTFPSSPYFGRVYLANYGANPGLGIYIEHADGSFEGVPTGTAEASGFETPFNSYIPYSGADGPYNLQVGSDGWLYVSDWSDGSGGIYREQEAPVTGPGGGTNGGLINGENVLKGYGEPNVEGAAGNHDDVDSAVIISGSTATGNLLVYGNDTHYGAAATPAMGNQMYVWNVGGTALTPVGSAGVLSTANDGYGGAPTPFMNQNATYLGLDTRFWSPVSLTTIGPGDQMTMFPTIAGVITNLARGGPANQFYVTQSRSNGQQPGLFVLSAADNNTVIWDSLDETFRQQIPESDDVDSLLGLDAVQTSPDGRFLVASQGSGAAYLNPYNGGTTTSSADFGFFVMPLLAGIPDLNLYQAITTAHGSNRQIAFDSADNVYTVNATTANEQVWAPGGTTTTVTGSNGTFANGGVWAANANGSLSNTANWSAGLLPNSANQSLTFGAVTTAQRTVSVDTGMTTGSITFSSPNGYVLSNGGGSITMSGFGVNLNAQAGANTISAPMSIQSDVGFYAASGASLTATAVSYSGTPDAVKNGPGTVTVNNLNLVNGGTSTNPAIGNLDIYAGKLALSPSSTAGSSPIVVTELSVYTGASLDVGNNDIVYDYNLNNYTKTSPLTVVEGLVASGSIFSSTAAATKGIGLAVVENTTGGGYTAVSSYDGQTLNPESGTGGAVIVKYTYYGDLNLDGTVTNADLSLMNDGKAGWIGGDLNYATDASGNYDVVTPDDYALFMLGLAQYNASHVTLGSPAPEPTSLGLIALAAIPMIRRRRA